MYLCICVFLISGIYVEFSFSHLESEAPEVLIMLQLTMCVAEH